MTQLRIEQQNGFWLVNGRSYKELSFADRDLLNNFFKGIKNDVLEYEQSQNLDFQKKLSDIETDYEIVTPENP